MDEQDVEKILDLIVWFYCRAKFELVWTKKESNEPIPLDTLTTDEKAFIIKSSLLNILIN